MARQPILNREQQVYGYELLFRNGAENYFRPVDGDLATASLISDAVHLHNVEKITDGHRCFINFTRNSLLNELYVVLPAANTVVEILESVELDEELLRACQRVRDQGYTLALDDYILEPRFAPLLSMIDLLKVEFPALTEEQHSQVIASAEEHGFELLAEKVETPEQFELARNLGYHYFQGYFFCRPQMLRAKRLPASRIQYLRLLQLIGQSEFNVDQIEELIRGDLSLSYMLLRYLNSSMFQRQNAIESVRHAITMLGQRPLRKWVSLITVGELSGDKPVELMNTCLIRARFCELLAGHALNRDMAADGFLVGMFSLLDAMLDQPMEDLIRELSLSVSASSALLQMESPLKPVLDLVVALENGNWDAISGLTQKLDIDDAEAFSMYSSSIEWSRDVQRVGSDSSQSQP